MRKASKELIKDKMRLKENPGRPGGSCCFDPPAKALGAAAGSALQGQRWRGWGGGRSLSEHLRVVCWCPLVLALPHRVTGTPGGGLLPGEVPAGRGGCLCDPHISPCRGGARGSTERLNIYQSGLGLFGVIAPKAVSRPW